jgi:GNAT superfamily N-acetyltransferase
MSDARATAPGAITVRPVTESDAADCARIVFEAFGAIHDHHRFQRDFPVLEAAAGLINVFIPHPEIWGIAAEVDGRVVGSNFLDERSPIRGVGPITVAPEGQNVGVGRGLMEAVIDRAKDAPGIRLLQDAFHMRSLALYESLGFEVKEPVAVIAGKPRTAPRSRVEVRALREEDLAGCEALCTRVHGYERTGELRDAMKAFSPFVALREEKVVAYASAVSFWPMNHGVAETDEDMADLLLGAAAAIEEPIAFLVPLRASLFPWALGEGLRLVKPMNLMARGAYQEPRGAWFPSVLY